jgi:hypothetical protein
MAQQTAIEWLINNIHLIPKFDLSVYEIINKAKAMEKEQIINAFDVGTNDENRIGKEYYNETYNK